MAKITIPGLVFRTLADGRTQAGYWVPSPTLRRAGWKSVPLGLDRKASIEAAERRNDEVAVWRGHGAKPRAVKAFVAQATFAALIDRYEAEEMDDAARAAEFRKPLSESTKRDYRYAFTVLQRWAEDGRTPVAAITTANIKVLKKALLTSRNAKGEVKRHRAATILTVLNMLLSFATAHRLIQLNPMGAKDDTGSRKLVTIPQPEPRSRIIGAEAIAAVRAAALELERPDIELGVLLGLWTLQREADILHLARSSWRACTDLAEEDRRVLAGSDGRVMAFRVRQRKTGRWVDIHALPELRARVEEAFRANAARAIPVTTLVADPDEPRPTPQWKFQRGFRAAVNRAIEVAGCADDTMLVEQLTGIQFRDLRRTGMCLMRELGLTVLYISGLSGHSIDETTKILETYMPADTRTNAAAIAMLATRLDQRAAAEKRESRNGD